MEINGRNEYDQERHVVWSNMNLNIEDFREILDELIEINCWDIDKNDDTALYALMVDLNNQYLNDERMNLENIVYNQPIIVLADIGRWNGRVNDYKYISPGKVSDCLRTECDYAEWYVDAYGDMRADLCHHDGNNHYLYRVLKDDIRDEDLERFEDAILEGNIRREDIEKYTEKIGDDIAKVYGWNLTKTRHLDEKTK